MEYVIILLEGIITFISPCMLPMLPIYITYFAGQEGKNQKSKTFFNVISFVIGFTIIFMLLGAFSATLGGFLKSNLKIINILLGVVIVLFGINFMEIINIPLLNKSKGIKSQNKKATMLSSFIFGIVFSVTWTPCVGAFLASALSIIVINGNMLKGILLILTYCLGLGIPFIVSALLIDKLKTTFSAIKKNYKLINIICGSFLCVIGILMATGLINKYFTLIS